MHATFQKYDDSEAVQKRFGKRGDLRTLPGCVHANNSFRESNVLTIEFSPAALCWVRDVLMNDKNSLSMGTTVTGLPVYLAEKLIERLLSRTYLLLR